MLPSVMEISLFWKLLGMSDHLFVLLSPNLNLNEHQESLHASLCNTVYNTVYSSPPSE